MANRLLPCPRCQHPQLLVPGVTAGICPGCRKAYTVQAAALAPADGSSWKACAAASYIGDTWAFKGRTYTFFGGVTWHDQQYDCQSTELFLEDDTGDEVSLEFEEDDEGQVVWWLSIDATGKVERLPDGSVKYQNEVHRAYAPSANIYKCVTQAGAMDSPYDAGEAKAVRWYTNWQGDLGRRAGRLGNTRELGQDTWFWMMPAAAPARRTSMQFETARREAWNRQNLPVLVVTVGAILLALLISIVSSSRALNRMAYDSGPLATPAERHWLSEPFELEGKQANVKAIVEVSTPVAWFDTTLCIANLGTQRRYCTVVELDSESKATGTGWTDDRFFSAVPEGRYVLEGQAETEATTPVNFRVKLIRDAPRRTVLWIALAILVGGPVVIWVLRKVRTETSSSPQGHVSPTLTMIVLGAVILFLFWIA